MRRRTGAGAVRTAGLASILLVLLASCAEPRSEAAPSPAIGSFGFDVAGMDRSVAPGDDFNAYASGAWLARTEIPADRSAWTAFGELAQRADERTRAIVSAAAADSSASGDTRRVGDYFTAFMDEAGIERRGLEPMREELAAIAAIDDPQDLARTLGESLRADVDLLNATDYYTDRLFGLWVSQDLEQPARNAAYLVQGGLGMPDRDFYLAGGRFVAIRTAYQAYIADTLRRAGFDDADNRAARILDLERAIARVHSTAEQTNDVRAGANRWDRGSFADEAPGLDWQAYFAAAGLATQRNFIVWQPDAVRGISALTASRPLADWKDYLAFRALDRSAPFLPRAFAEARFDFYGRTLSGAPEQPERWKRAVGHLNAHLGQAVGRLYVERHFSPEAKAAVEAIVRNLVTAFGERIDSLAWMSDETRVRARRKLEVLSVSIGYPDRWRDYSGLEIRPDDALGNARRASLYEYRRNVARLTQHASHDEWYMLPHEVNALNVPLENRLIFPAAILEAPFFDPAADPAVNYGGIGAVIGHEITHSFDSTGALFDETGRLSDWWTPEDLARFEAAGDALAAQYDAYRAFPDLTLNGRQTLGENIADVAGLATAYDAWRLSLGGLEAPVVDGFTGPQRFFLGWAQVFRAKYREPALRNSILTGVHSPGPWRVATVRNQDAWYQAFGVEPGQDLYLPPGDRVRVW